MFAMSEMELRAWGYWSNRFSYDPRNRYAEITSTQASGGDWPINRPLLQYALELVLLKGWTIEVVMTSGSDVEIDRISVLSLGQLLEETPNPAKDQDHGPYYYIDEVSEYVP